MNSKEIRTELWNKDCLEYLTSLEDNSIELIITSPPYNAKHKGGDLVMDSYPDNLKNEVYEKQQLDFLNECYRVLKPQGAMFYNHKNRSEKNIAITPYKWVLQSKFNLKQVLIWNRLSSVDFSKNSFTQREEFIFWLYKDKVLELKRNANLYSSIWNIARPIKKETLGHKATFPKELIYRIINCLDVDYQKITLLDPYLGTGTTLQVGKHFNISNLIGCELDNKWLEIAKTKIDTPINFSEELLKPKSPYKRKVKCEIYLDDETRINIGKAFKASIFPTDGLPPSDPDPCDLWDTICGGCDDCIEAAKDCKCHRCVKETKNEND